MEINATAECTFSKINETTVSLPIIGKNIEYTFDIALSEEEFNWTDTQNTYKFYADSSILPESFTITMNNKNIATFTKDTKTLIVDLIAVREVINTHYGDTTHKENIYSMYDDGTRYKISIRVA